MQVIEIPDTTPTGQSVSSRVPLTDPLVVEYVEQGTVASDASVLAVSSPLDSGGGSAGSLPFSTRTVSVDTAARPGELLEVDASGDEVTVTPPSHPLPGAYVTVVKVDYSPNLVRWRSPVNGDPEGAALQGAWAGATFIFDGSQWVIESVNTSFNAAAAGGGSGRTFVQPEAPVGADGPYLWVQTGLPGGKTTIWIEDGI